MRLGNFSNIKQKNQFGRADIIVIFLLLAILYAAAKLGSGMEAPFSVVHQPMISLNPIWLPIMQGDHCFECLLHLQHH